MNDEEVKTVVKQTVNELLGTDMIKYGDQIVYEQMSKRLREYYKNPEKDKQLGEALRSCKSHPYYDLLEDYYGRNYTLETMAYDRDVDLSTVVRNKKALCLKLFKLVQ